VKENRRKANILNSMRQYSTIGATLRRLSSTFFLALLAAVPSACSRADSTPAVATVGFATSRPRVAVGSPVDLTYRFDVAPNAQIAGDYRVFVHVLNPDGEILWSDDHDPEPHTSQWKGGQHVQYNRTIFVPATPFTGDVNVEIGLYKDNDRLALQGPDAADRESPNRSYRVGTFQLAPPSENIFIIYKSGWHPSEFAPEDPKKEWQWTQKSAVLTLRNPRKDVTVYLQYDARPDLFPGSPQNVTVLAGDQPVETFVADSPVPSLRKIAISAAQLGTAEMAEIRLDLDRTFVPAQLPAGGRDTRELGIRVYKAFVEPR